MKNNLKLFRTKSGFTQEDISKKIGVSRQTINSIENNRYHPSILLCLKLSKELECKVDDLFRLE
jgi:putative transcriptional regulator|tara:strand:- start:1011 stop:1202 length:192 start_codon:yes stop_codon:yes gene_type:complete